MVIFVFRNQTKNKMGFVYELDILPFLGLLVYSFGASLIVDDLVLATLSKLFVSTSYLQQ